MSGRGEYWREQAASIREIFLQTVAEDIGVPYVSGDRKPATILRLAYSVAGRNALAALWDAREEDETAPPPWRRDEAETSLDEESGTSVRRFRERIAETLRAFLDLFADDLKNAEPFRGANVGNAQNGDEPFENGAFVEVATDGIFELYRRCGFFYHSPFYVEPPMKTAARVGESFAFVRGVAPCDFASVAGLGTYWTPRRHFYVETGETRQGGEEENEERGGDWLASATFRASVAEMFAIDVKPLKERFKLATRGLEFAESDVDESSLEFLETNLERESKSGRRSRRRYWKEATPEADDERVSLARIPRDRTTGADAVYFWTRVENRRRRYRQIPSWQTQNGEWRSLANAALASRDALPATSFNKRGDGFVEFNLGYLASPSEQNFLELYSWPLDWTAFQDVANVAGKNRSSFRRETTEAVFDAARSVLEAIGSSFKESV
ncbi:MAG: hypothetical protein IJE97_07180 [Thermoguttaceae bacterium]|nr:hypothetical protein [Thermoguttaceae bacterium]